MWPVSVVRQGGKGGVLILRAASFADMPAGENRVFCTVARSGLGAESAGYSQQPGGCAAARGGSSFSVVIRGFRGSKAWERGWGGSGVCWRWVAVEVDGDNVRTFCSGRRAGVVAGQRRNRRTDAVSFVGQGSVLGQRGDLSLDSLSVLISGRCVGSFRGTMDRTGCVTNSWRRLYGN
jgi:hypothetical protein